MCNCKCNKCCGCKNMKEDMFDDTCDHIPFLSDMPNDQDDCACGFDEEENLFPDNPMFGQSYVPIQRMNKTFEPSVGLRMGTIFPELVSPYAACQSLEEIAFIKATNKIGEGCNR